MKIIQLAHRTVDELLEEIFSITSKKKIDTNDRRVLYALACAMKNLYEADIPKWIPVERELPEDMQFVLLTVRRLKNGYNHEPFISVGYIGWNHQHWWCAHDGDCEISKVEVIAWMPLPEPYKPNNE